MIHVMATIELLPGTREDFLREFRKVVPKVRAEDGCLGYGPHLDVETDIPAQLPYRPDSVTIIERWESIDALQAHLTQPHMGDYRDRVKDYVNNVSLQILEPA